MWLLNAMTRTLEEFLDERATPYAILSHTWTKDEVTFKDVQSGSADRRAAYTKLRRTCEQALEHGLSYFWIDTCCINKESSAELSEAINSMFRWYSAAKICYACLEDASDAMEAYTQVDRYGQGFKTSHPDDICVDPRKASPYGLQLCENEVYDELSLDTCRWFERGWTLQELIAPSDVRFFGPGWQFIGTKQSLLGTLAEITRIDPAVLQGREPLSHITIASKMSWAASRKTSRIEDRAYSLLGIFDISMPMLYGEGHKAFIRLQEEIMKRSTDQSIFAWAPDEVRPVTSLLASSPDDFEGCGSVSFWDIGSSHSYVLSNKGLEIRLPTLERSDGPLEAILNCSLEHDSIGPLALYLRPTNQSSTPNSRNTDTEITEFFIGSHPDTMVRAKEVPVSSVEQASRKTVTILRQSQDLKASSNRMNHRETLDEKVLLRLRAGSIWSGLSDVSIVKSLSTETNLHYQVFTPTTDNQVHFNPKQLSPVEQIYTAIHEGYAIWRVDGFGGFAVAIRISKPLLVSSELRIAIFDPTKHQQTSGYLGTFEFDRSIYRILNQTAPSMHVVITIKGIGDIEARAHREVAFGEQRNHIKIDLTLHSPDSTPKPNIPVTTLDDYNSVLRAVAAAKRQLRGERHEAKPINKEIWKSSFEYIENVSAKSLGGSTTRRTKRKSDLTGSECMAGRPVEIVDSPQHGQDRDPDTEAIYASHKRSRYI